MRPTKRRIGWTLSSSTSAKSGAANPVRQIAATAAPFAAE
jgi:hypothetical protein